MLDAAALTPQAWYEVTAPPPDLAAAAAAVAAREPGETLAPDALARLVLAVAERDDLWRPLVVDDRRRRRYRLLCEDARLDIWVLSWMPGQGTGFHDHGRSSVALAAVQGAVLERQLRIGAEAVRRELRAGLVQRGAPGYIHSVSHARGEPAVTLHAYSPPLLEVGQYRAGADGELLRVLQHGRQELLDHTLNAA
jgi:predicted metal-dependent enzyme (double-stranded beta helix superfamily)